MIDDYLKEIRRFELLSREQERALASEVSAGSRTARQDMINSNLRLVVSPARKYQSNEYTLMDAISEGNIGLITAVDRFDVHRGYRFSTYAMYWIVQAISRARAEKSRTVKIPYYMVDLHRKWKKAQSRQGLPGHEGLLEAARLAQTANMSLRTAQTLIDTVNIGTISTHAHADEGRILDVEDRCEDQPDHGIISDDDMHLLSDLLSMLPDRAATVLKLRFGIGTSSSYTLEAVGKILNITRERVRQIETTAIKRLHDIVRFQRPDEMEVVA